MLKRHNSSFADMQVSTFAPWSRPSMSNRPGLPCRYDQCFYVHPKSDRSTTDLQLAIAERNQKEASAHGEVWRGVTRLRPGGVGRGYHGFPKKGSLQLPGSVV